MRINCKEHPSQGPSAESPGSPPTKGGTDTSYQGSLSQENQPYSQGHPSASAPPSPPAPTRLRLDWGGRYGTNAQHQGAHSPVELEQTAEESSALEQKAIDTVKGDPARCDQMEGDWL